LGHIGILVETFVDLRIYFMNCWAECVVIHTLQCCGTRHLTDKVFKSFGILVVCVHTGGISAGQMW